MKLLQNIKRENLTKEQLKTIKGGSPVQMFYLCTKADGISTVTVGVTSKGGIADYVESYNSECATGQEIVGCRYSFEYV